MSRLLPLFVATSILVGVSTAQQSGAQDRRAGYGSYWISQFNTATQAAGNPGCQGCAWINGGCYLTYTGVGGTPPHIVILYDITGTRVASFNQPTDVNNNSVLGLRDGATDGRILLWGSELGIHVMDTAGNPTNLVQANNGPQLLTSNPITGPGLTAIGAFNALALNPGGNAGNGSLWVGNGNSNLLELDLSGNILTNHPNNLGWDLQGLAWDGHSNTLWANTVNGEITEINPANGAATGNRIIRPLPAAPGGGLDSIDSRSGAAPGFFGLYSVDKRGPGYVTGHRVDLWTTLSGEREAWMQSAVNGGTLDTASPKTFANPATDTISFNYAFPRDPTVNGRPAAVVINALAQGNFNGITLFFPELVALHPASNPPGVALLFGASISTTPITIPLPDYPFPTGQGFRMQTLYLEPLATNGLVPTNQVRLLKN